MNDSERGCTTEEVAEKEEYREKIISIFSCMNRLDKLRFWYKYISNIEKDED